MLNSGIRNRTTRLANTIMSGLGLVTVLVIICGIGDHHCSTQSPLQALVCLMASESTFATTSTSIREDHELIAVIRNREVGFEEAASVLTERLGGFLVAIISSVGRLQTDDLMEVTQQTWIRAFTPGLEEFNTAAEFRSWLKQVARSRALDLLRKRPHVSIPDTHDASARVVPTNPYVLALELCLKELDSAKPEFAVVVRGVCAGKPGQQLGDELGISTNTVYSRFDRSKQMLKECIERRLA